jgi:hypothetical protein
MPDVSVQMLGSCPEWDRQSGELIYPALGELPDTAVEVRQDERGFRFHYSDGVQFETDPDVRTVRCRWPADLAQEDAAVYLLGPILGFALRRRGITCLHASAVEIGGQAVAFLGPGGAGKSTIAAQFAQRGLPTLSDDIVALQELGPAVTVQPGFPRLLLWPKSVGGLFGSAEQLPLVSASWTKRYWSVPQAIVEPLPLQCIYLLDRQGACEPARIEAVNAGEALRLLVGNSYLNYLLDAPARALDFEMLARLLRRVPLRRLIYPSDWNQADDTCRLVLRDALGANSHGSSGTATAALRAVL